MQRVVLAVVDVNLGGGLGRVAGDESGCRAVLRDGNFGRRAPEADELAVAADRRVLDGSGIAETTAGLINVIRIAGDCRQYAAAVVRHHHIILGVLILEFSVLTAKTMNWPLPLMTGWPSDEGPESTNVTVCDWVL